MIRTDLHFRPLSFSKKVGFRNKCTKYFNEEPIFLSTGEATYDYRNSSVEVLGIYQYKNSIKVGFNVFDEKYDYIKGAKDTGTNSARN
jgi:hypothetical protein